MHLNWEQQQQKTNRIVDFIFAFTRHGVNCQENVFIWELSNILDFFILDYGLHSGHKVYENVSFIG